MLLSVVDAHIVRAGRPARYSSYSELTRDNKMSSTAGESPRKVSSSWVHRVLAITRTSNRQALRVTPPDVQSQPRKQQTKSRQTSSHLLPTGLPQASPQFLRFLQQVLRPYISLRRTQANISCPSSELKREQRFVHIKGCWTHGHDHRCSGVTPEGILRRGDDRRTDGKMTKQREGDAPLRNLKSVPIFIVCVLRDTVISRPPPNRTSP